MNKLEAITLGFVLGAFAYLLGFEMGVRVGAKDWPR